MKKGIKLVEANQRQQIDNIRRLYKEAFPAAERKPFSLIQCKCREGATEMLAIEDEDGAFLGLAITILDRDIALLDYFAIAPECREGGIGSAAFGLLKKRYEKKRFLLEIENTAAESIERDPDVKGLGDAGKMEAVERIQKQRLRRKSFYLRNGMTQLPFYVNLFGVDMEMLSCGCAVEFVEYRGVYEHVYGRYAAGRIRLVDGQIY